MRYLPCILLTAYAGFTLACTPSATRAAAAAPDSLPRWEGLVTTADSVQLFTRIVGTGPDTVVVLHGGPGFTLDYIAPDLGPLAAHHVLLFYDQRGAGRSTLVADSAGLDAARFVDDLEAIRTHFHLDRLNLLGHSWGAGLAALYAIRFPAAIHQLIIVDGIPLRRSELIAGITAMNQSRDTAERNALQRWMDIRRAHPEDAAACLAYYRLWFRPFFNDPTALARSRGDFCAGTPASRRNKIQGVDRFTMASIGDWDWRAGLATFPARTLIIHGTVDPLPFAGAEEWAATLPNARLVALPGVGHFPYLEAPAAVFSAIDTFLAGNWPPDARRGHLAP
ncbi:MAG TPA: alpha/beta fold hydrolase [Gemmatimonadales bacterium]|nr:alpha/beta fold hydrolase [Gemmatimonadales bacterium]